MATNLVLAPELQITYDKRLLQRFRTKPLFAKFGLQKSIPARGGVNISVRRMDSIRPMATATTATWPGDSTYTSATGRLLTEGTITVPSIIASWYEVTATVRQYGIVAAISELDINQAIDPQVSEYVDNFGEAGAELIDVIVRDVLITGTSIQYVNGRTTISGIVSGDFINLSELRKASRTLKNNNAPALEDGNYVVFGHPNTTYDLQSDSNITNVWVTGGGLGKEGEYWKPTPKSLPLGFNYYESTIVPISRASGYGDVYNTFVLGKDAYMCVKLDTMPAKVIYHGPGSGGTYDPLDQVATVGFKCAYAAAILDQGNMVIIRHQTTAFTGTRAWGPITSYGPYTMA